jgi:hypothetical protein
MYIKWFGTVLGWWSMIIEHKQYQLKKICRTPKNYIKHLVMQQEQYEHLQRLKRTNNDFELEEENKFLFLFEANKVVVIAKGYPVSDTNHMFESLYEKFAADVRLKFPDKHVEMLMDSRVEDSQILSYKKIRVGNSVFSTKKLGEGNKRADCYMELKPKVQKKHSQHFVDQPVVRQRARARQRVAAEPVIPQFAICQDIYSIHPFQSGEFKDHVVYYFACTRLKTLGHHRSLWYVDLSEEGIEDSSTELMNPNDFMELQGMVAQHGDLEDGQKSVMRIGRDTILYAPLNA